MTLGEQPDPDAVSRLIDRVLADDGVVVFCNDDGDPPRCRFSRRALSLVSAHCEDVERVDVTPDPEAFRKRLTPRSGWASFPQVFVDGRFVGDDDVLADLAETGDLERTLCGERRPRREPSRGVDRG